MDELQVAVYPADRHGCGFHRLIWVSELLAAQGVNVTVVSQEERHVSMTIDNQTDEVVDVALPEGANVVVFQRTTHRYLAQAIPIIRAKGVAVVVDVDDDLSSIHPDNPAWDMLRPNHRSRFVGKEWHHSWHHLGDACRDATLVTATTPALRTRYATHGRGAVLRNYLAPHYYGVEHVDSTLLGWPASLHSHPNDPDVVGNAIARLIDQEDARLYVASHASGVGRAFGLSSDDAVDRATGPISLQNWPDAISRIGIGIAPLADTKFNQAKSWLKPLELSAVGVPWVASPRAEYRRLHELGCGLLADRPKDWFVLLRRLMRDESRRLELAEAGRSVAADLRLVDHAWRWAEAWTDALRQQRVGREPATIVT